MERKVKPPRPYEDFYEALIQAFDYALHVVAQHHPHAQPRPS
jgi:hypothetical protein